MIATSLHGCVQERPPQIETAQRLRYSREELAVSEEEIALVPDLTLGSDAEGNRFFYRPRAVAVDATGAIFVIDAGMHQLLAFEQDGTLRFRAGRQGGGPGEFDRPSAIAVVGEAVVVVHTQGHRWSLWRRDGSLLSDHLHESDGAVVSVAATPEGGLIFGEATDTGERPTRDEPFAELRVSGFGIDGDLIATYFRLPRFVRVRGTAPAPYPTTSWAAAPDGTVYSTDGASYTVTAHRASGPLWQISGGIPAAPLPADYVESMVAELGPQARDTEWPELLPVVRTLEVDGHGHLYVFRYDLRTEGVNRYVVDVYDSRGRHLYSGRIPRVLWSATQGEHVYALETDQETDETVIVRYVLSEPF